MKFECKFSWLFEKKEGIFTAVIELRRKEHFLHVSECVDEDCKRGWNSGLLILCTYVCMCICVCTEKICATLISGLDLSMSGKYIWRCAGVNFVKIGWVFYLNFTNPNLCKISEFETLSPTFFKFGYVVGLYLISEPFNLR